ncbi:hypothetical protein HaLaN_28992, partial [Haematococcus lacustris]
WRSPSVNQVVTCRVAARHICSHSQPLAPIRQRKLPTVCDLPLTGTANNNVRFLPGGQSTEEFTFDGSRCCKDPGPAPASSNRRQFCLTIEVPLEITDDSTCPEWADSSMLRACSSQQQQYYTTARWQHRAHIYPGE